jgi:hypothetical protein
MLNSNLEQLNEAKEEGETNLSLQLGDRPVRPRLVDPDRRAHVVVDASLQEKLHIPSRQEANRMKRTRSQLCSLSPARPIPPVCR